MQNSGFTVAITECCLKPHAQNTGNSSSCNGALVTLDHNPTSAIETALRATRTDTCALLLRAGYADCSKGSCYAADNSIGSTIEGSSFSGLLTRVEIGHIRIGSAGNGRSRSPGSDSSLSQRM